MSDYNEIQSQAKVLLEVNIEAIMCELQDEHNGSGDISPELQRELSQAIEVLASVVARQVGPEGRANGVPTVLEALDEKVEGLLDLHGTTGLLIAFSNVCHAKAQRERSAGNHSNASAWDHNGSKVAQTILV